MNAGNARKVEIAAARVDTLAAHLADHGDTVSNSAAQLGWGREATRTAWRKIVKELGWQAS